jgi:hypothetical protein
LLRASGTGIERTQAREKVHVFPNNPIRRPAGLALAILAVLPSAGQDKPADCRRSKKAGLTVLVKTSDNKDLRPAQSPDRFATRPAATCLAATTERAHRSGKGPVRGPYGVHDRRQVNVGYLNPAPRVLKSGNFNRNRDHAEGRIVESAARRSSSSGEKRSRHEGASVSASMSFCASHVALAAEGGAGSPPSAAAYRYRSVHSPWRRTR